MLLGLRCSYFEEEKRSQSLREPAGCGKYYHRRLRDRACRVEKNFWCLNLCLEKIPPAKSIPD